MTSGTTKFEWTDALDARLFELYGTERTYAMIAVEIGCNPSLIASRIKHHVRSGAITHREPVYPTREVWSAEDDEKLKKMYLDDVPVDSIADVLKRSSGVVFVRLQKMLPEWKIPRRGNIIDTSKLKPKFVHVVPEVGVPSKDLKLENLASNECRFPTNSPPLGKAYLFCGHKTNGRDPYCDAHQELCGAKTGKKKFHSKASFKELL